MSASRGIVEHLVKVEERLLRGDAGGAIIECGAVVVLTLRQLFDVGNDVEMLGVYIGRVGKAGLLEKTASAKLNRLNKARIAAAHPERGEPVPALGEVEDLTDFLYDLLSQRGLLSEGERDEIRARAGRKTLKTGRVEVASIDRKLQRATLAELMDSSRPLLVFLTHGERDQGHAILDDFAFQLAKSKIKSGWRCEPIRWPSRWQSVPAALCQLLEQLAGKAECELDLDVLGRSGEPSGPEWRAAV
ncbi:MAG TPA: hypothetical protein VM285_02255, partial [Polyangia bacterium]|nr:hypothetical protein [Polyangia bacterium]